MLLGFQDVATAGECMPFAQLVEQMTNVLGQSVKLAKGTQTWTIYMLYRFFQQCGCAVIADADSGITIIRHSLHYEAKDDTKLDLTLSVWQIRDLMNRW